MLTGAGEPDAEGLGDAGLDDVAVGVGSGAGFGLAGVGVVGFGLAVSPEVSPVGESVPGALLPALNVCVPP